MYAEVYRIIEEGVENGNPASTWADIATVEFILAMGTKL
jgi:hypothetical protein